MTPTNKSMYVVCCMVQPQERQIHASDTYI